MERKVNHEAVRLHAAAIDLMEKPQLCPFCSMMWDQAEAERLLTARDHDGYAEWLEETIALPVNATGPDLGQRAEE